MKFAQDGIHTLIKIIVGNAREYATIWSRGI